MPPRTVSCIHTCTHTNVHTQTQCTYYHMHTYIHVSPTDVPAHTCVHTHTYLHLQMHTHTHIYTHAHTHPHTHIYTHTHTCPRTHMHTCTCTRTHIFPNKILSSMRLVLLVYLPIALSTELSPYYTTNRRPTNRSQVKMFAVFCIGMSKVTSPLTIYK